MISPNDNRVLGVVEACHRKTHWQYIYEQDVQTLRGFVDYATRALEHGERDLLEKIRHELTAPITGIRNNAGFLGRRFTKLAESLIQTKLADILADCEIMMYQVRKLQYVFDLGIPTFDKRRSTLVVRDIIIKTINQLKPLAREKGAAPSQIRYRNEDIPKIQIYVDREKLNQVVYNLLINAIKYAGDVPSTFNIFITVDETQSDFIVIFRDWGIGIESGYEEKIFERGFRTPDAVRHHITGTGLGLTIAREIARELGGDVRLARNRQPTEFHLILPKSLQEAPSAKQSEPFAKVLRS
jgi:signal transduction histidine kinase